MIVTPRAIIFASALLGISTTGSTAKEKPSATQTAAVERHRSLTLEAALSIALKQNPDILKAVHEIERTRGQVIEIRAQALPNLQAAGSYNQYAPELVGSGSASSGSNGFAGSSTVASGAQDKSWRIAFQVQQILYSGGKVKAAVKIAELTQDTSLQMLRETVNTIVAKVRTQFYAVLLNRELITVAEESIVLLTDQLKDQQNRFDAGTIPRFNILQAEVALANARPNLIRAKNNFHISRLQLAKTLGFDTNDEPDASGTLRIIPRKVNLARALDAARKDRAILKAQTNTVASGEQQITVAKAGYKPTLNADVGYEFVNSRSSTDLSKATNGWYLGVNGAWAIFDGFQAKGQVMQARASLASAKVGLTDSTHQVELEVQQAYAQAKVAREVIDSQTKVVEQANEALRLAKERLNAGAGTQLDVLNAQVALTTARSTQKQALADYNVALAEYDRATGAEVISDQTLPQTKFVIPSDIFQTPRAPLIQSE
ncbi:MAG: TolC family protein [Chthoniobacteraceae bacterium]